MEITAVIVVRGGSVRLKNKNLLQINGKSILGRKIQQLKQCNYINRIVVGSEDDLLLEEAKKYGAEAIRRPYEFCDEKMATANDMIANMMTLLTTDVVVWAHCTNPLITPQTYDKAIKTFLEQSSNGYDSLLSVYELREHLWKFDFTPANYDPYASKHVLASQLAPFYAQDGGIFIQPYEAMAANSYFFGKRPYLYILPPDEIFDINTPHDFDLVKAYIEAKDIFKK